MKNDQASRTKGVHGKFIVYGLLCLAAIALAPYCVVMLFKPAWKALVEHPIKDAGNTLLVTAHPDDETVFFGPTITALHSDGHEVFLLCLTTGNFRGLGPVRVKELTLAAHALHIEEEQLRIKNETKLADGHTTEWDIGLADSFIQAAVKEWNISTIVTFDRGGITGHKNHLACWQAVRTFIADCIGNGCPSAWSLLSAEQWRRSGKMLDEGNSRAESLSCDIALYLNRSVLQVFKAMYYHKTQWRWWKHILFTRYTWMNKLQRIKPVAVSLAVV